MPFSSSTTISPSSSAEPRCSAWSALAIAPKRPVQSRFLPVDARLDAVAVVLDLVHPFRPARRPLARRGLARLDERRQQLLARAGDLADVGQRCLARALLGRARRMIHAQRAFRRDLVGGAPRQIRGVLLLGDLSCTRRARELVLRLDQQPWLGLLARLLAHAHQMPFALEARAVEHEREMAFVEPEVWIAFRHPGSAVPHDHGAAAVLALRDVALEIEIGERMILGVHGEALVACDEARPARDRPALEHAVELEPQVEVQPPRIMPLHHEREGAFAVFCGAL
jgi:hypothetical protein